MRLNPHHPERFWNHLGRAYLSPADTREAIEAFRRISTPDQFHHANLAASSAMLGDEIAAAAHARAVLALDPMFSVASYLLTQHYQFGADREHHREALMKATLPA